VDVVKALMKYPGSKWRIARWIIVMFSGNPLVFGGWIFRGGRI